jgi:hypothetical protein
VEEEGREAGMFLLNKTPTVLADQSFNISRLLSHQPLSSTHPYPADRAPLSHDRALYLPTFSHLLIVNTTSITPTPPPPPPHRRQLIPLPLSEAVC